MSRFTITLHHAKEKFFTYDNFHANTMYIHLNYFVPSSTCEGQQAIKIKPPSGQNRDLNFHQELKPIYIEVCIQSEKWSWPVTVPHWIDNYSRAHT